MQGIAVDSYQESNDSHALVASSFHTTATVHTASRRKSGGDSNCQSEAGHAERAREDDALERNDTVVCVTKGQLNKAILAAAASDKFAELVWEQLVTMQEQHEGASKTQLSLEPHMSRRTRHRKLRQAKQTLKDGG